MCYWVLPLEQNKLGSRCILSVGLLSLELKRKGPCRVDAFVIPYVSRWTPLSKRNHTSERGRWTKGSPLPDTFLPPSARKNVILHIKSKSPNISIWKFLWKSYDNCGLGPSCSPFPFAHLSPSPSCVFWSCVPDSWRKGRSIFSTPKIFQQPSESKSLSQTTPN